MGAIFTKNDLSFLGYVGWWKWRSLPTLGHKVFIKLGRFASSFRVHSNLGNYHFYILRYLFFFLNGLGNFPSALIF